MNIAVIGIGGVGGFFGGKLAQLLKSDSNLNISFVARGEHLREIQKKGLLLDSDDGVMTCVPTMATGKISDIPVPDLCLVCVKSFDLKNTMLQLKEKVSEKTILLPLLNGVDIYERMREIINTGIILPSYDKVGKKFLDIKISLPETIVRCMINILIYIVLIAIKHDLFGSI